MDNNMQAKIRMRQRKSKCWPNPEQELLLNACLFQGERAIAAWEQWRASVDFEGIDSGSYRLLPQLYRNLSAQGITAPLLTRCKGIYRKTWYDTQLRLRTLADLCRHFHEAGIPTLTFKGAALALQYYQDCGIRPMADVDLLIPIKAVAQAECLLQQLGWHCDAGITQLARVVRAVHAYSFKDEQGQNLDLHWHLPFSNLQDDADDQFWDYSMPLTYGELLTRTLSPTDQLLCICLHGLRWNPSPSIRWIADAFAITQVAGSDIDWSRLVDCAYTHQSVIAIREALRYLRDRFAVPIPEQTLQTLDAISPLPIEHSIYLAKSKLPTLAEPNQMIIANQVISSVTAASLGKHGYRLDYPYVERLVKQARTRIGILSNGLQSDGKIPSMTDLGTQFSPDIYEVFVYLINFDLQPSCLDLECQKHIYRLSILPFAPIFYKSNDQALWSSVETIRSDGLDLLLITSSLDETGITRLLALHRLAPVQLAWVDSPVVTAINSVDYVLYSTPNLLDLIDTQNRSKYLRVDFTNEVIHTCNVLLKNRQMAIRPPEWVNLPCLSVQDERRTSKSAIYLQKIRENLVQIRRDRDRFF